MGTHTGIEVCSCDEALFLRGALEYIKRVATADTPDQYQDLYYIQDRALKALSVRRPGGEQRCSCEESQHLRNALRACANVARDGEGQKVSAPIHDVAQCSNFADQGLNLLEITGDPGVYGCARFIPGTIENARWSLGRKLGGE